MRIKWTSQEVDSQLEAAGLSCIVSSHYLATIMEHTELFACAVVIVTYRVCRSIRLL
jgi:hypothetical protein